MWEFKTKSVTALGITVFATVGAALTFDAPLESSMCVASLPILIALYHIFRCFQSIENCATFKSSIAALRGEILRSKNSIQQSKTEYQAVLGGGYQYMLQSQKRNSNPALLVRVDSFSAQLNSNDSESEFEELPGSFLTKPKGKNLIIATQITAMLFSLFYSAIILLLTIRIIKPNTSLYDKLKWLALGSAVLSGLITLLQHLYTRLLRKQANKIELLHADTERQRDVVNGEAKFEVNKLAALKSFEQHWHDNPLNNGADTTSEMTKEAAYKWFHSIFPDLFLSFSNQRVFSARRRTAVFQGPASTPAPGEVGAGEGEAEPLLLP